MTLSKAIFQKKQLCKEIFNVFEIKTQQSVVGVSPPTFVGLAAGKF